RDHRLDLEIREHLVDAVLLGIDHLPAQRQDRLEETIACVNGRSAGRVALDEEELCRFGVVDLTVGELPRQRRALQRALAARELARLSRGLASTRRGDRLLDDPLRLRGVLLEEMAELL